MKKKMLAFLFAGLLSVSGLMTGCGGGRAQKAQEYKELGITQMAGSDYESALDSFQKALDQSLGEVGAEEIDICYYKALAQFKSGDVKGAIETYTALIDYDKKNWEVYYLRGSAYLQDEQRKLCLKDYDQAIELNGKDYELYTHIFENLSAAGYEEEGQGYLKKALELKPSGKEGYAGLGYAYFLSGDYENAEENLKKSVDEGYDKALLALGQVYAANNKSEEAKTCFEKYMEKYPKDAEALNELGGIALGASEYAEAATYFEKAMEVAEKGENQSIWRNLITAYEYAGEFEKALDEAKDYIVDYPRDDAMQREYEFLQTRVETKTKKQETSTEVQGSVDDGSGDGNGASDE